MGPRKAFEQALKMAITAANTPPREVQKAHAEPLVRAANKYLEGTREKAHNVAKEIVKNRDGDYAEPLVRAANKYLECDTLKDVPRAVERAQYLAAQKVINELSVHLKHVELLKKVLSGYEAIFYDVSGVHYNESDLL